MWAAPGGQHAFTDLRRGLTGPFGDDLAKFDRRHFDMNIDPVQQWARNAIRIILNLPRRTARFARHFSVWSARRCLFVKGS
jgi:hypothetical protein